MSKHSLLFYGLFLFFLFNFLPSNATVSVTYPIANSMVLQRNMKVPIWGKASAGESVQVAFDGQTKSTTTGTDGKWKVVLDSMSAAGPLSMTIKGTNTITLSDIYVGEVWNCAGQSNMDLRLYDYVWNKYNTSFTDTINAANNPLLRYIDIRYTSLGRNVGWHAINPNTAGGCSATAYFFGKQIQKRLGCAVGLVVTAVGGTYIESWLDPATIAAHPGMILPAGFTTPGDEYNSFVAPVIPYAIRGTICMHGEQNSGDANTAPLYGERFKELINGWRAAWGEGDFPFYYGQLTMYDNISGIDTTGGRVLVRDGQAMAQSLPNTGMAVMLDLSAGQWHFPNKYEAGRRLALLALAKTYGLTGFEYSGPVFQAMGVQGNTVIIHFTHAESGLATTNQSSLSCFFIAGDDNVWHPADIYRIVGTSDIAISNNSVPNPKKVCYGYGKDANLMNKDHLPASLFRSDKFWSPRKGQILYFDNLSRVKMGTADYIPGATTTSGLPIHYESSDTTIAKITSDGLVHLVNAGICKLTAYQPGNSTYRPSVTLTQILVVSKNSQSVQFDSISSVTYGNDDLSLNATASSGLPIYFTSSDTTVAKVNGSQLQIVGAGKSTISAKQDGDVAYYSASTNMPLVVTKALLHVQAVDTTRYLNVANPNFRLAYSGFIGNDSADKLDTLPIASCTADKSSPAGTYPIIISGGSDSNYNFKYINGIMTILNITGTVSLNDNEIMLYPSPVKNKLHISLKSPGNRKITIVNSNGNVVYTQNINLINSEINVNSLPTGVYFIKILDGEKVYVKKIIKV